MRPAEIQAFLASAADPRAASELRIQAVEPYLAERVRKTFAAMAALGWTMVCTEGRRTLERQRVLLAQKATKTLKSKHLTGRAVDCCFLVNGRIAPSTDTDGGSWNPSLPWRAFAENAKALGLRAGLDWGWDAPHLEMRDGT